MTPLQKLIKLESVLTHMFDSDHRVAMAILDYIRKYKKSLIEHEREMTKAEMKWVLDEYLRHIRDYGALPYGPSGHRYFTFVDLHKGAEEFLDLFQDDDEDEVK